MCPRGCPEGSLSAHFNPYGHILNLLLEITIEYYEPRHHDYISVLKKLFIRRREVVSLRNARLIELMNFF